MIDLLVCLMIATFLPFVAKVPLAMAMHKESRYDNRHPRQQQQRLEGFGARANAAHYNSFEALACFAPAVLVNMVAAPVSLVAIAACYVFIGARILYLLCYWLDVHFVRSSSWLIAMAAIITLYVQAFDALSR